MQTLDLNLASNPFRNNTLLLTGYVVAFILLGLFTFWNVRSYLDYRTRLNELETQVGTFESQRRDLETRARRAQTAVSRVDIETLRVQAHKANEFINWKAFSWTRLFNEMERVQPHRVRMNSIRPIFRTATPAGAVSGRSDDEGMPVSIEGTAKSFADFTEFEQSMQDDAHFGRVEPENLRRTPSGDIVFELRFAYVPDVADRASPPAVAVPPDIAVPSPARPDAGPQPAEAGAAADPAGEGDPAGTDEAPPEAADDPGTPPPSEDPVDRPEGPDPTRGGP